MGQYFLMSRRYNKKSAEDFGLKEIDAQTAQCRSDGSLWKKTSLYDFGWGKEYGYCRLPEPKPDKLIDILINSSEEEDCYGAASILMDKYPDKLLTACETMAVEPESEKYIRMYGALQLNRKMNYNAVEGKSLEELEKDHERWMALPVPETAKKGEKKKGRLRIAVFLLVIAACFVALMYLLEYLVFVFSRLFIA